MKVDAFADGLPEATNWLRWRNDAGVNASADGAPNALVLLALWPMVAPPLGLPPTLMNEIAVCEVRNACGVPQHLTGMTFDR